MNIDIKITEIKRFSLWNLSLLLLSILSISVHCLYGAQDAGLPGEFISYGAGARSLGMGRAYTAVVDDASGIYWNSAGLLRLTNPELSTSFVSLYEGTNYNFTGYALNTKKKGAFGVGIVYLGTGGIEYRQSRGDDANTSNFSASEFALMLPYAHRINYEWAVGASLKLVNQNIRTESGSGVGFDLSATYKPWYKINLGLSLKNLVAPTVKIREKTDTYPLNISLGTAYHLFAGDAWILALDLNQTSCRSLKLSLGTETSLWKFMNLRAGYNENEISGGFGFKLFTALGRINIDYALAYHDSQGGVESLGTSHRIGLSLRFDEKMPVETILPETEAELQEIIKAAKERLEKIKKETEVSRPEPETIKSDAEAERRDKIKGYHEKALENFERKYYREAISQWRNVLMLDPNNMDALKYIDKASNKLDEQRKQRQQEINAEKVDGVVGQARIAEKRGELREALDLWQKVFSIDDRNIDAKGKIKELNSRIDSESEHRYTQGLKYYQNKQLKEAVKEFEAVLKLNPNHQNARNSLEKARVEIEMQGK
ncbi:MAG: PorV/PorQ family protein [Elusimicrobiota bacterium]